MHKLRITCFCHYQIVLSTIKSMNFAAIYSYDTGICPHAYQRNLPCPFLFLL
uniref:Uncharacterized protein n=1 Tax=Arundo donax TaxID=35708 RepID=A0A0A9ALP5_ARUDO